MVKSDCLEEAGESVHEKSGVDSEQAPGNSTFKTVMSTRVVHLLAFFILVYVGVEVTIGGGFLFNPKIRNGEYDIRSSCH